MTDETDPIPLPRAPAQTPIGKTYRWVGDHVVGVYLSLWLVAASIALIVYVFHPLAVVVSGATLAFGALLTENSRYSAWKFVAVPLYSKIDREKLLQNDTRSRVYEFIKEHPGMHYKALLSELQMTNGSLIHHLSVLEREKFVLSERDGRFRRFYPYGTGQIHRQLGDAMNQDQGLRQAGLSPIQQQILETVRANPGISQRKVADAIGTSRQVVSYNMLNLVDANFIKMEKQGRSSSCYFNPAKQALFDEATPGVKARAAGRRLLEAGAD